jgi:hypothetical protein
MENIMILGRVKGVGGATRSRVISYIHRSQITKKGAQGSFLFYVATHLNVFTR